MKNIFVIVFIAMLSTSCTHMYNTKSGSKDNVSYIVVLKEAGQYNDVSIVVDDKTYQYGKVYKVKSKRKASPLITTPGKHSVKVIVDGKTVTEENVFMGLQETKTIVLK